MRQVSITRNRSFVGCAVKLKVYVEDAAAEEITIQNVPCRKLGTLKNGETATFEVPVQEVRIFVIADKLSKDICCDVYRLSAGEDAVSLSGKCRFSLATQNAFRFDNNNTQEAQTLLNKEQEKRNRRLRLLHSFGRCHRSCLQRHFLSGCPKNLCDPGDDHHPNG